MINLPSPAEVSVHSQTLPIISKSPIKLALKHPTGAALGNPSFAVFDSGKEPCQVFATGVPASVYAPDN